MPLELRHLRYFLAVAEELNFSRAAERLHIAQPALSAQIRVLETQLGCELFARTTRKVELTPAGELLLEDAREIVARADEAEAKLVAVSRGRQGLLRVGFAAHGAGETGTSILRRFADEFPGIETKLVEAERIDEIQRRVRDRETDVAFAWVPIHYEELVSIPVASERKLVALNAAHPLASEQVISTSALESEPIVGPWDEVSEEMLAFWYKPFRPEGRREGDLHAKTVDESLSFVARGLAVYCVPESVERFYPRPQVVFRPIAGVEPAKSVLVWHRDTQNPAVESFVAVSRSVLAEGDAIQSDNL
jgi:DNA-binding transcriptional LysR family regulator